MKDIYYLHFGYIPKSSANDPFPQTTNKNFTVLKGFSAIRILAVVAFLFSFAFLQAATFYSVRTGNWSAANTWSAKSGGTPGLSVPVAGDTVIIERSYTVTITAAAACATLNIAASSVLTVGGFNFTVSGATSITGTLTHSSTAGTKTFGDVTVNTGGTWISSVNEGSTITGNLLINGTFTAGTGAYILSGTSKSVGGATAITIPNLTVNGTVTNTGTLTITTALSGTGTLTNAASGVLNLNGTTTITSLIATTAGNLVRYARSAAQAAIATTYCNLTLGGSGAKSFPSSPTITGTLSMEASASITVAGTGVVTYGPNATLQYNTPTSRTVSSAEWLNTFTASGGIKLVNTGVITLNSAKTLTNSPLTVKAGATISLAANNLSLNTGLELECATTTAGSRITGTSGLLSPGGNINVVKIGSGTNGASITSPINLGSTRTFIVADDGTSAADLTINGVISGVGFGIIKDGPGTLILTGASTFSGTTTINAGTVKLGATGSGANSPLGTTVAGTIVANGATLDLNGYTLATAEGITLNGTGLASAGALANSSGTAVTYTGSITLASASSIGNTGTITASGTISGSGSLTKTGTGILTLSGTNTFTGGVTLNTGTLNINNLQALGTVAGIFTINGGIINNTTAAAITTLNYPLVWNADFTYGGTRALNLGTGTVTLNGDRLLTMSGGTLTIGGPISAGLYSLTKAGGGTLALGSNTVMLKDLTISAGPLVSTSGNLTLSGNFTNSGVFTHNSGTVVFSGSSLQKIDGTTATTFSKLTLNNSSGLSLINGVNTTVAGVLTLTSGNLTTNANRIILPATGSIVCTSGYVAGNLQKNVATGTNVSRTFEVGDAIGYAPVTLLISRVTTAGNLSVKTTPGEHTSLSSSAINPARDVNRYWTLTNSGIVTSAAGYTATLTFNNPADLDAGANTANFIVARYASSAWTATTLGTKTSTSTQATIAVASAFGDLAIGELKPTASVTTLASSANPSCSGTTVVFTASVTSGGAPVVSEGTVTFKDVLTTLGTSAVNGSGQATYSISSLTVGTHPITATFNGTTNFGSSISIALSQGVITQQWIGGTSGDWENAANWCGGGVPGSGTNVDIPSGTTIHITSAPASPAVCNNLTINSGATLIINAGKAITVNGLITNNATTGIVIKSDATGTGSLLDNGISGPGTAKVERYLTKYLLVGDGRYHFLSSPVSGQSISPSFSDPPGNSTDDFYKLDETTYSWINFRNTAGTGINSAFETTFTTGRGYLVAYNADVNKSFTGTLNTGTLTTGSGLSAITYTSALGTLSAGWNLVGNPYPSAIDWNNVVASGLMTHLDAAVYVYDNYNQIYYSYVGGVGSLTGGIIPAMQGFLVKANASSPSLTLNNLDRVHSGMAYYKSSEALENVITLKLEGNSRSDETNVRFMDGVSADFNENWDAYKLMGGQETPAIYSTTNQTKFAVKALPLSAMSGTIPIAFVAPSSGTYTLSASGISTFTSATEITLEDRMTGITQKLNDNVVYTFSAVKNDDPNRFLLHFLDVTASEKLTAKTNFNVYQSNGLINISAEQGTKAEIIVSNMLGQQVLHGYTNGNSLSTFNVSGLQNGVYVVNLVAEKMKISKKIVIQN